MKQILCFGDSNTWGLVPGENRRFEWGVRWTSILQENLKDEDVRIIEDGLCGRTSVFDDAFRPYRNGSKELPRALETNRGIDGIVIMLGTNDCKAYLGANEKIITLGVETLVKQVREFDPGIKILLMSPIHLGEGVWEEAFDPEFDEESVEKSKKLKEKYRRLAYKYGIDFLAASDYAKPSVIDREHMDAEGHAVLAKAVTGAVRGLLEEKGVAV